MPPPIHVKAMGGVPIAKRVIHRGVPHSKTGIYIGDTPMFYGCFCGMEGAIIT